MFFSKDQQDEIRDIQFGGMQPMRVEAGQRPDPSVMEKQRQELLDKVLAVLTDKQKATYEKMKGKAFDISKLMGPPPPPPPPMDGDGQ